MSHNQKNKFAPGAKQNLCNQGKKKQVFFSLEVLHETKSDTQTLVLGHIAYHHAKHGKFNSSVSSIAKHLCYSINAVKNALSQLLSAENEEKQPLLFEESTKGYSRTLRLNLKHQLGYRLLQSYTQIIHGQQAANTLPLYGLQLHLFDSKSRYDSRHQHKMLMLHALISSKIKASKLSTRNKRDTYQQSISQLSKKLGWAYMTVKSLIETMRPLGLLSVTKEQVRRVAKFVFGEVKTSKAKVRRTIIPIKDSEAPPIERYRDIPIA